MSEAASNHRDYPAAPLNHCCGYKAVAGFATRRWPPAMSPADFRRARIFAACPVTIPHSAVVSDDCGVHINGLGFAACQWISAAQTIYSDRHAALQAASNFQWMLARPSGRYHPNRAFLAGPNCKWTLATSVN